MKTIAHRHNANTLCSGEKLTIKATGNLKETLEKGFKMHLTVKYGLITLINQDADGCDTVGKADLDCPVKKGERKITKDVDIPREVPPVRSQTSPFLSTDNGSWTVY
jgi:hypothetical protein